MIIITIVNVLAESINLIISNSTVTTFTNLCIMIAPFTEKLVMVLCFMFFTFFVTIIVITKEMMCVSFVSGQVGRLIRVDRHSLLLYVTVLVVIDEV